MGDSSGGNNRAGGACVPPVLHSGIRRSGAGMPWGRPAVDGPCGCGWGKTLMRGSRLGRLLGIGSGGRAANTCGCATAVVSRATVSCTPTPDTLVRLPGMPHKDMGRTVNIMVEAVVPAGPWRVFIGGVDSATMFGPYTDPAPAFTIFAGTIKTLRAARMDVRINGDVDSLLKTFHACGADLPEWATAFVRGL